jgi:integrase
MASHLTDQLIAEALAKAGALGSEMCDAVEPGLSLRVGAGAARWSYRVEAAEKTRLRIPLGTWPDVTVIEVRHLVAKVRASFCPPDPSEPLAITVDVLLERYRVQRLSQLRKGTVIGRAISSALAPICNRDVITLGRRDISQIVDGMAERAPIHANRVLAYLKAFFGWAVGRGYLEVSPAAGISKPTREIARDRTPSLDEVVEIWDAAGELGYPFGPAIQLLILTASRRDEIGGMRVEEISDPPGEEGACWTLPASRSKNTRAIRMPIVPAARLILTQAMADRAVDGPFVFSTTGRSSISGWSRAKRRIDQVIRARRIERGVGDVMPEWRLHDLRRAFATAACDQLQIDPAIADRCLNHVGAATTSVISRVYARNELFEQRRDALERWAQLLEQRRLIRSGAQGAWADAG